MSSLEERLTELEVRLAFIDDGLAALNAAVAMHDQTMLALRLELDRLRSDLVGLRSTLGNDVGDEPPPPHY
ncbi:MAG: SlyX family protein [Xanthomonadales bacterium]|jgi:SlyX protein|uniref:SlyX family protein n=1 Tax=Dokdonella sp. TaxID=2291710 RepID=UPI002BFA1F8E|nr:SlyX family protein [Xanthomonadales bacterium]HQV72852.1 SlyX family protein [Dokdonella sp.]MBK7011656.1 SlyX family protein [Xanthomonadales bacterium]MBK7209308.1 SlyX family protein [Xanthomonadales bacterium]MBL0223507.1 SlyX family protein [Xanthomonadales bacterium]